MTTQYFDGEDWGGQEEDSRVDFYRYQEIKNTLDLLYEMGFACGDDIREHKDFLFLACMGRVRRMDPKYIAMLGEEASNLLKSSHEKLFRERDNLARKALEVVDTDELMSKILEISTLEDIREYDAEHVFAVIEELDDTQLVMLELERLDYGDIRLRRSLNVINNVVCNNPKNFRVAKDYFMSMIATFDQELPESKKDLMYTTSKFLAIFNCKEEDNEN